MLHSLAITVPGCMSCMSNKPTIVLHAVPLPPHTLHLSSLAEEPSIMSQPTGYKTYTLQPYAIKKAFIPPDTFLRRKHRQIHRYI